VMLGVLMGSAPNALGTNDITIGSNGVLEANYDINSPHATLRLDGKLYLHQDLRFRSVVIGGTTLSPARYTFAQLAAAHPNHFPVSWTQQSGSSFSTGLGSVTVLGDDPIAEPNLRIRKTASGIELNWNAGQLQESAMVTGGWTTLQAASPLTLTPTGTRFYRVVLE
jgi:hypothetical protein